jgi:hypothetical protein
MRCNTVIRSVIPLLALPLLSGCLEPEYLSTRRPGQPLLLEATASLRDAGPPYTRHASPAGRSEVFSLILADTFSLHQRAKILRAINEWNVALNGLIRFEIVPERGTPSPGAREHWVITSKQGLHGTGSSTALAATYFATGVGGMVAIYVDRIGRRDLGGVVMHELGHVLGLGHSTKGGLMAAQYHPTSQRCVDRATVAAVATRRGLPLAQMNWCEDGRSIARGPS